MKRMICSDLKVMVNLHLSHSDEKNKMVREDIHFRVHVYSETDGGKTPREILDFLRGKGGHSLLIKGKAGTGKTTLALQIIEELIDEQVDYYLSTRVSDESLYNQFPWLKEKVRRNEILRAGKVFLTKARPKVGEERSTEETEVLKAARELLKVLSSVESEPVLIRSELQKLEGQIEAGELGESGEEPSGITFDGKSMILEFGMILPELEIAYDLVETNLPRKTLVVIDSIEALSEQYGIPPQRIMSTLQKDLVDHSGTNIIYVMETWENSNLDYLGDGVVFLNSTEREGRRIRELIIEKLRGSRIDRWKYVFTLLNGRLHAFEPSRPEIPQRLNPHFPVSDPDRSRVSSGNEALDGITGGFPCGGLTLVEIGKGVPQEAVKRLELCLVADFISKMRGVIWFPLYSMNYDMFTGQMEQLVSPETMARCLRILHPGTSYEMKRDYLSIVEGSDASHDLKWNTLKYLLSGTNPPHLSLLGYDALESLYGREVIHDTTPHLDTMRRLGNVIVVEATAASRSIEFLANQANIHIKLEVVEGTVMVCGEKPYTPYYNLRFRDDILKPLLLPVV